MHEGDIREYRILVKEGDGWRTVLEGEAESGSYLQRFSFAEPVEAAGFRLEVLSGYTRPGRMEWMEEKDGWHRRAASAGCRAEFSILSLIPVEQDGRNPAEGENFGQDEVPWKKAVRSKTKEIDD